MEADVAEAAFWVRPRELLLPVGTQSFIGATCADAGIEHRVEGAAHGIIVHRDYAVGRGGLLLCVYGNGRSDEAAERHSEEVTGGQVHVRILSVRVSMVLRLCDIDRFRHRREDFFVFTFFFVVEVAIFPPAVIVAFFRVFFGVFFEVVFEEFFEVPFELIFAGFT